MTAFVEILQETPELQKGVDQDVRITTLADGVKVGTDTASLAVTFVNAAGTTVASGAMTSIATGEFATKILGSAIATETVLTATIAGTISSAAVSVVQEHNVVGSNLFQLYSLRSESGTAKYTSSKFSDLRVIRARALVTEFFEKYCNTTFVKKYRTYTVDGNGKTMLEVPINNIQTIARVSIDAVQATAGEIASMVVYDDGKLYNPTGWGTGQNNVTVEVIAGPIRPPLDISRVGLEYVKWVLSPGNATDRTLILTDETGTYRLNQAGSDDRPTGFPTVDFALNVYREIGIW